MEGFHKAPDTHESGLWASKNDSVHTYLVHEHPESITVRSLRRPVIGNPKLARIE